MSRSSYVKIAAKLAPVVAVALFLTAGVVSLFSLRFALLALSVGLAATVVSSLLRQKQSLHDTRTVVRQELRGVSLGAAPSADASTNEASKRLVAIADKLSREQSPVARELHIKTVEEIRFLQAQLDSYFKGGQQN